MNRILGAMINTTAPWPALFVRLSVGGIFLFEGIKKFLFVEQWGAGRFERIGIPSPHVMAPFVGIFEVGCGALLLMGLLTRLAALPLVIDMIVAITSTKIPILMKSGFWPMEAEARTDFAMICGLLFLALAGAGPWSIDGRLAPDKRNP